MTKKLFIDTVYMELAIALDMAHNADGEILDWAMTSRYAQERVWVLYRLNQTHSDLKYFLLHKLHETYFNSLLKRNIPKSLELMLHKVNIAAVAESLKVAL